MVPSLSLSHSRSHTLMFLFFTTSPNRPKKPLLCRISSMAWSAWSALTPASCAFATLASCSRSACSRSSSWSFLASLSPTAFCSERSPLSSSERSMLPDPSLSNRSKRLSRSFSCSRSPSDELRYLNSTLEIFPSPSLSHFFIQSATESESTSSSWPSFTASGCSPLCASTCCSRSTSCASSRVFRSSSCCRASCAFRSEAACLAFCAATAASLTARSCSFFISALSSCRSSVPERSLSIVSKAIPMISSASSCSSDLTSSILFIDATNSDFEMTPSESLSHCFSRLRILCLHR
mmetsp:Transcript_57193/g.127681  ORF Transcript_57193/g.127681 Transcript_57193/m.127681 type:complete len:294 (-) Transcript_57193:60-941(-)